MGEVFVKKIEWMNKLKPDKWKTLSPKDRLDLLQKVENLVAESELREPRIIVSEKMIGDYAGCYGYYSRKSPKVLHINEDIINNTKIDEDRYKLSGWHICIALATVFHEGRHAFQDDCAQDRKAWLLGKETENLLNELVLQNGSIDRKTLKQWIMQLQVYFPSPKKGKHSLPDDRLRYYFQPNEDDAEGFANKLLNQIAKLIDDKDFSKRVDEENKNRRKKEKSAKKIWNGSDFREKIATELKNKFYEEAFEAPTDPEQSIQKGPTQTTLPQKRKISPVQYVLLGGTLLWLFLMYWIAAPSGLLQHLLWFVSAAIPFVPVVLLLRIFPSLRNKKGGILLLALFAILLLLIQKLYFWFSIAYLVVGTISLFKGISNILPDTYTVTLENADGTKTTETHILGDNPEQDIKAIDSGYTSQGYTKK